MLTLSNHKHSPLTAELERDLSIRRIVCSGSKVKGTMKGLSQINREDSPTKLEPETTSSQQNPNLILTRAT
jgi:hypothetical protein